jgi:predicted DNA-binding protein
MPTVSIHLPDATYKRLREKLGGAQKASAFGRAAIEEKLAAAKAPAPGVRRIAARLQEMLEDEIDIRIASERLARLDRGESKTRTGEEVWRELGLQD